MVASTPTLEDGQSQTISDVDFSGWLTEDSSTPGNPDSDFDKLFSQNTMHIAASESSHWRAVDWHSFDDFLKPEVEAIEQHQEPAEAILPEIAPEADHKEPAEATGADVIPATAPQEPADATSPELTSQLAPQAIIPKDAPISEKLHSINNPITLQHNGLPTKTELRRGCTALTLVIDLTGPEPKDDSSNIVGVHQGCGSSILKNNDDPLVKRVNRQNPNPRMVPLSTVKRKRPTSASNGSTRRSRRKTTVQEYVISDRLFTSTALKEIDNLMEAQSKYFKAASKDFEASQHFEDTVHRLMTLRILIVNHGAMEEEAIEKREHSC
ncbi:hypothetical protein VE02_05632 [Pseudogymnoascus sp. 03VT05]|nr:hypothetical protein VE02_05632 [Pseudogymnoascus sp. 03VT05]